MSDHTTTDESSPGDRVKRLASSIPLGKRWEDVEAEVQRMSRLPQSDWVAKAEDLHNETLVFLIGKTHRVDEQVCGPLLRVLKARTISMAGRHAKGFDEPETEDIVLKVEGKIVELVLTEKPSRDSDFLQLSFATVVQRLTLNAVRAHKR